MVSIQVVDLRAMQANMKQLAPGMSFFLRKAMAAPLLFCQGVNENRIYVFIISG